MQDWWAGRAAREHRHSKELYEWADVGRDSVHLLEWNIMLHEGLQTNSRSLPTRSPLTHTIMRRYFNAANYLSAITFQVKPLATSPSYATHTSGGISCGIWKSISGVA